MDTSKQLPDVTPRPWPPRIPREPTAMQLMHRAAGTTAAEQAEFRKGIRTFEHPPRCTPYAPDWDEVDPTAPLPLRTACAISLGVHDGSLGVCNKAPPFLRPAAVNQINAALDARVVALVGNDELFRAICPTAALNEEIRLRNHAQMVAVRNAQARSHGQAETDPARYAPRPDHASRAETPVHVGTVLSILADLGFEIAPAAAAAFGGAQQQPVPDAHTVTQVGAGQSVVAMTREADQRRRQAEIDVRVRAEREEQRAANIDAFVKLGQQARGAA